VQLSKEKGRTSVDMNCIRLEAFLRNLEPFNFLQMIYFRLDLSTVERPSSQNYKQYFPRGRNK
jgi:hypothetical protein